MQADHWFWDTEVLVLANKNGFSVKEIQVVWDEGESIEGLHQNGKPNIEVMVAAPISMMSSTK